MQVKMLCFNLVVFSCLYFASLFVHMLSDQYNFWVSLCFLSCSIFKEFLQPRNLVLTGARDAHLNSATHTENTRFPL